MRLESIILSRSTRSRLESRSHMKESLFFVFFKIRNPKSQAPNLRVSGVGCQVSGKRNIKTETWTLNTETLVIVICNFH